MSLLNCILVFGAFRDLGKQHVARSPSTVNVLSLACAGAPEPRLSPSTTTGSPCPRCVSQLLPKFDLLAALFKATIAAGCVRVFDGVDCSFSW